MQFRAKLMQMLAYIIALGPYEVVTMIGFCVDADLRPTYHGIG